MPPLPQAGARYEGEFRIDEGFHRLTIDSSAPLAWLQSPNR